MSTFSMQHRIAVVLSTTAAAFALSACGQRDEDMSVGQQVDNAISSTQSAATDVQKDVGRAVEQIQQSTTDMAASAERTAADLGISAKVNAALVADDQLKALKIDVDTRAGHVTLSGSAPDAQARDHATELAQAVDGVVSVDNRLVVAGQG